MAHALRSGVAFTALTLVGCPLLIIELDKPLVLLLHRYAASAVPLFATGTAAIDAAYQALNMGGRPTLLLALALAYLLGRWVLRWQGATVFLLVLLTHVCSAGSVGLLKMAINRPRPAGLWQAGAGESFSFPSAHTAIYWSLFWPLALAFPRWRGPLLAVPVFIALGRLVLGEHFLSDVWAAIWLVVAWEALWGWVLRGRSR